MLRSKFTLCFLGLLAMMAITPIYAAESEKWETCDVLPGRLIVSFKDVLVAEFNCRDGKDAGKTGNAAIDDLFSRYEILRVKRLVPDGILNRLVTPPDFYQTYILFFPAHFSTLDVLDDFALNPYVRSAEPDVLRKVFRVPNDALWSNQWDKRLMGAHQVWDVSTGSRDIICAGIDTGVDWDHPDLTPSLWVNPGEDIDHDSASWSVHQYPGDLDDLNGEDDDQDGFVDDFLGWDFIASISNCVPDDDCDANQDNNPFGYNAHGTHVAGIMCASGNNGIGVAGMSWVGRLMALRAGFQAYDGMGYIHTSAEIGAILYAAAHDAKVINMSYGGPGYSQGVQDALNAAWNQGALLFAASGNDGSTDPQYPAANEHVIAVNATDSNDRLAHWSNRGPWTHLCAPGSFPGIMSTVIDGYDSWTGTSMASPNAAGVAALVWSVFPQMTNAEIRDLLFATSENITSANPNVPAGHLGHGRVDAWAAVAASLPEIPAVSIPADLVLKGNYPNPFNSSTTIMFDLRSTCRVKLQITDLLGRIVENLLDEIRPAGSHQIPFDASHLTSGVYIVRIETAAMTAATKMMLIK